MPGKFVADALVQGEVEEYMGAPGQLVTWETLVEVSTGPGVYAWFVRGLDDVWCLVYVGIGTRLRGGVRHRLRGELSWVRDAGTAEGTGRQRWWSAHPRTILAGDGQVWVWPTETAAKAREAEAELLELSVLEAGAPPLLNGKAWWSDSLAAVNVRDWWDKRLAGGRSPASHPSSSER